METISLAYLRRMRKLPLPVLLLLLSIAPVRGQVENSRELFSQIDPVLQGLSEITGLKAKHKVPADYISKAKLEQFIRQRIRDAVKPEEIRVESLALRMFGFIPDDYDLKQAIVELMTEQAAAFYDYERKKLFITESDTSFLEKRAALVHELAHALADQSFPLGKFMHAGAKSDDAATAREAVVEGQATWLMWAYVTKLGGGEARVPETVLESMKGAATSSVSAQYPVFEKAPLYLRESLIFPYSDGLSFADAVFAKLGKDGFSEVFRRAPVSTQQILHPELYLAKKDPVRLEAPTPRDGVRRRKLAEGSVGELDFRILFAQYAGKDVAERVPPHWRGGAFRLYESRRDRRPLMSFATEWDSPEAARDFFEAYCAVLAKKWKRLETRERTAGRVAGVGDRGGFEVTLSGTRASSVEGIQ